MGDAVDKNCMKPRICQQHFDSAPSRRIKPEDGLKITFDRIPKSHAINYTGKVLLNGMTGADKRFEN